MMAIDMLEMLTKRAKEFRNDRNYFYRNTHMHAITTAPTQDEVDAVLAGFINTVAAENGIDYALYASDLSKP